MKPAKATDQFLVYCEIDTFGRGFTVIQRVGFISLFIGQYQLCTSNHDAIVMLMEHWME